MSLGMENEGDDEHARETQFPCLLPHRRRYGSRLQIVDNHRGAAAGDLQEEREVGDGPMHEQASYRATFGEVGGDDMSPLDPGAEDDGHRETGAEQVRDLCITALTAAKRSSGPATVSEIRQSVFSSSHAPAQGFFGTGGGGDVLVDAPESGKQRRQRRRSARTRSAARLRAHPGGDCG